MNYQIKSDELQFMIVSNEWIRRKSKNHNAKEKLFYKIPLYYHKIIIPIDLTLEETSDSFPLRS
jgi:hypothetical protein